MFFKDFKNFSNIKCINCCKYGHTIKYCNLPIVSYGILCYSKSENGNKFLLVQRKDSLGYIEFIRGKYHKDNYKILIEEMTLEEKLNIIRKPFDELWDNLWTNHRSRIYRKDKKSAKIKFMEIDAVNIVKNTLLETKWLEQEFCIPKGRKNEYETELNCAIREFSEETGFYLTDIKLREDLKPLEEVFTGSNDIVYKHIYYIAEFVSDKQISPKNIEKLKLDGEIKNVKWFNYKDCMKIFRTYEITKRDVIYTANKIIGK